MNVRLHPHARQRAAERGAQEDEIVQAVLHGEQSPAKFGRQRFRRNFAYNDTWRGRTYATKQVEAYAAPVPDGWVVITVIVKFF
jgi:hypothetical protein